MADIDCQSASLVIPEDGSLHTPICLTDKKLIDEVRQLSSDTHTIDVFFSDILIHPKAPSRDKTPFQGEDCSLEELQCKWENYHDVRILIYIIRAAMLTYSYRDTGR